MPWCRRSPPICRPRTSPQTAASYHAPGLFLTIFLTLYHPKGVQCTPVPRSGYKIMELDRLDLFLPSSQFAKNLVLPLAGPSFTCHKEHQLDQGIQNSSFCFERHYWWDARYNKQLLDPKIFDLLRKYVQLFLHYNGTNIWHHRCLQIFRTYVDLR